MANALYGLGREAFLGGDIDWDANDIRAILGDAADYTVSIDTHQFLSSVAAGARVATSGAFTTKSKTLGVADADDLNLATVTGDPSEFVIIYQHTGSDATARLIAYIDTATGLPITPNGSDIAVVWDAGANKIFKL
jgi:hypothetical protein